jgi:hypothetical protein
MPERGEWSMAAYAPESMRREAQELERQIKSLQRVIEKAVAAGNKLLEDPVISEGAKASARTVINLLIAVADAMPEVGGMATWGADAAKAWSRYEHAKRVAEVVAKGGDPKSVKPSPIDLIPDVNMKLAIGTDLAELATADLVPAHIATGALQLTHDWDRIRKMTVRLREHWNGQATVTTEELQAAETFGVSLE